MSKTFTPAEVAQHKDEKNGIYIIVDDGVYDITSQCFFFFCSSICPSLLV